MNKKFVPKITWQVDDDGPIHEIPEGARVKFNTAGGIISFYLSESNELGYNDPDMILHDITH